MPKQGYCKLTYELGQPPAIKQIVSDELCYLKVHSHGTQPTQKDIDSLTPSLLDNVQKQCTKNGTPYPGDQAVIDDCQVVTFSRVG